MPFVFLAFFPVYTTCIPLGIFWPPFANISVLFTHQKKKKKFCFLALGAGLFRPLLIDFLFTYQKRRRMFCFLDEMKTKNALIRVERGSWAK